MSRAKCSSVSFLVALAAAFVWVGCQEDLTQPPGQPDVSELYVGANLSGTNIAALVVEVTASDILEPLIFNIPIDEGGHASGVIRVPVGSERRILVRAYDSNAIETHRGEATVNVMAGANPPLTVVLYPLQGDLEIEIRIGELSVIVDPQSAVLRAGQSIQLTATVTGSAGVELTGDVQWGSSQPLVATVDGNGLVTAVGIGVAEIAANFGNARGSSIIQVLVGYHSSFDVGAEGWVAWDNASEPVRWRNGDDCQSGMGGCISLSDGGAGYMAFRAPPDWRDGTDLSEYYGGQLTYWIKATGGEDWIQLSDRSNVIIESALYGQLYIRFPDSFEKSYFNYWKRVVVNLSTDATTFATTADPSFWQLNGETASEQQISDVLSSVTNILIAAELRSGDDTAYLDEVQFTTTPADPYAEYTEEMVTPVYVDNVVAAFNAIPDHGLYLQAYTNNHFDYGCCDARSHIQGIQRLRGSDYLALSSNDFAEPRPRIAVVQITSTPGDELLASNENPPADDRVVMIYTDFEGAWEHAGGMATCGDILVVPLENGNASEIHFLFAPQGNVGEIYDLSDRYESAIVQRPSSGSGNKAGAVALTRFPSGPHEGHYLLAVLTDGHEGPLDFYLSNTRNIFDGFHFVAQWDGVQDPVFHGNQNMDFIMQSNGDIYLLGTDNTNWLTGADWAELYRVQFGNESFANPTLTHVASTHFYAEDHGNFDGGAGLYINHDGKLALYSVEPFTSDLKLKMIEFGWPQAASNYWVILYDDKKFKDRRLLLYGTSGHYLPNYQHIFVDGEWGFNDKASSVAWLLPPGTAYLLFEDDTYGGAVLPLVGNGQVQVIEDLGGFSDKISSSKFYTP